MSSKPSRAQHSLPYIPPPQMGSVKNTETEKTIQISQPVKGGDLFIVDNSDADWKVCAYLSDWCELSKSIDIATGYFEIGALLSLGEKWQSVDHIRILMGDEVSLQTKRVFEKALEQIRGQLEYQPGK